MENITPKKQKNTTLQVVMAQEFKAKLLKKVEEQHPYATSESQKANIAFREYLKMQSGK